MLDVALGGEHRITTGNIVRVKLFDASLLGNLEHGNVTSIEIFLRENKKIFHK